MIRTIFFGRASMLPRLAVLVVLVNRCPDSTLCQQIPTAATSAKVKTDNLAVFRELDKSSPVERALSKGDPVYVDLRVDQAGMSWCGVRTPGQPTRIGFVDCRSLERVGDASSIKSFDPTNAHANS